MFACVWYFYLQPLVFVLMVGTVDCMAVVAIVSTAVMVALSDRAELPTMKATDAEADVTIMAVINIVGLSSNNYPAMGSLVS